MQPKNTRPSVGDWIEVDAPRDKPPRRGLILEVLGAPGHERYRVRWDEQHESVLYPSGGARVLHHHGRRRRSRAAGAGAPGHGS